MKNRKVNWFYLAMELFVVFLGISAGFFLQNYKENKTNIELEQSYFEGFRDDLSANIKSLKDAVLEDSLWLRDAKYAVKLMAKDSLTIDSANSLIANMLYFSKFTPQTNTYENIINSGNLNIIRNYGIRQQIVAYYKDLKDHELLDNYFQAYSTDFFMPFVMKNYSFFNQKLINPSLRNSVDFKNVFVGVYALKQQRKREYSKLLKESEELLKVITKK